ncbi:DUF2971 domain-containing protein [Shewanella seohaensis]|uniref:DUF2971 domain-containing protein n=1 Tax=Shewanella seohaensis TaxID=755175 RepID=UPI00200D658A|nr:DUF2971 domain-containing protein [Shewanella seohaensis]MCL1121723.1 DUF2971 domain-containing protein [Shewanella seohaensis]UXM80638.1 DUF2971 domain-containing protein [Shewanella seohaensis]
MGKQQVFYKYKSLDNFEFLLDLILKERLYAALHHELNDPMEGVVKINGTIPKDKEQEWDELIKTFRLVCFSRDKDHPLMWSHYADGARGCVIEFQLMDDQQVHNVTYLKKPMLTERHMTRGKAEEILVYKEKHWKYESESRCLLGENNTFLPIYIKSVTFGSRAEKSKVDMLLHILSLCKPNLKVSVMSEQDLVDGIKVTIGKKRIFVGDRERTPDYCPQCAEVKMTQDDYVLRHRGWKDA